MNNNHSTSTSRAVNKVGRTATTWHPAYIITVEPDIRKRRKSPRRRNIKNSFKKN